MKTILGLIAILGILIYATLFTFTFVRPAYVEEIGKDFIKEQIQKKTHMKIDGFRLDQSGNLLEKLAGQILESNQTAIALIKATVKARADEKLAAVLVEMSDQDCECRKKYQQMIKGGFEWGIDTLITLNEHLDDFMKTKYMQVTNKLKQEFRIFTGCNVFVFTLLFLISLTKPIAVRHLFLPAILLSISTLISSYFYVFEQNWLLTILFSSYVGFAYLGYVGLVFLILCDIVFNRARVTTSLINAVLQALGEVNSLLLPC